MKFTQVFKALTVILMIVFFTGCNDDTKEPSPLPEGITSDTETEGNNMVHDVTLSKSDKKETYSFNLEDGTANKGVDFGDPEFSNGVSLSGSSLSVPAGVSSFTVTIPTIKDLKYEPDETYKISIGGISATGTIINKDVEVQDFVWNGMNTYYLWQESVPDLKDDRFKTEEDYIDYIFDSPEDPEDFFEELIYNRETVDKWSWIVDDYVALEDMFQGISKNNGVDFGLVRFSNSNDVFGYVRYILPDSDASDKPIKRGDLFTHIDGQQLNISNYRDLLFYGKDNYTMSLAKIENNTVVPTGVDVNLTKEEYTENPVYITKTFDMGGKKIGYLMYNTFTSSFDNDLNEAFSQLQSEGITDLVLDLRYNPGGSVRTAVYLASMITGQFKGQLFTQERWNAKVQKELESQHPDWLVNNFTDKLSNGQAINSLQLNSLHMIVTRNSASASELIINGLNPYIDIKLIGERTVGKYVASVTLYDSPNFGREGANPRHKYAIQPIVLEELNKLGVNDKDGFDPDIERSEDLADMGVLGEKNEYLLSVALADITGTAPKAGLSKDFMPYELISSSKLGTRTGNNMYVNKEEIRKVFQRTPR